jgi:hypothetical protein
MSEVEYRAGEPNTITIGEHESIRLPIRKGSHFNPVMVSETEDELTIEIRARVPEIEGYVRAER